MKVDSDYTFVVFCFVLYGVIPIIGDSNRLADWLEADSKFCSIFRKPTFFECLVATPQLKVPRLTLITSDKRNEQYIFVVN